MKIDATSIALILSILSPIITSFMNNKHQLKMHDLNFYQAHRAEVLEHYISATGKAITYHSSQNTGNYNEAYGEFLIYINDKILDKVQKLNILINNSSYDSYIRAKAVSIFDEICVFLRNDLPRKPSK